MELPAFHLRLLTRHQQPNPPQPEPQADEQEQSEVVENTAMWRAAANLTTAEYAYARFLKLKRSAGEKEG